MSESRNSSESRDPRIWPYSYTSSESREYGESRTDYSRYEDNRRFNNLEEIDELIKRLENENLALSTNNPKINQSLEKRRKKIEELKRLNEEAKQLKMIKEENDSLDDAIKGIKNLIRRPNKKNNRVSSFDYSGESHDSGESRW